MKHILNYLMLSLSLILFSSCNKEDSAVQLNESKTEELASSQTIQLNVVAGMTLPSDTRFNAMRMSEARSSRIELNTDDANFRPSVKFNESSLKAKLYLRKKNSTNPKDIFSVTINYGDWTRKTVKAKSVLLEGTEKSGGRITKSIPTGKNAPRFGEQWEAAVILGDGDNDDANVKSKINLNDRDNAPFTKDGVWIVKPRTMAFSTANKEKYQEKLGGSVDNPLDADVEDDEDLNSGGFETTTTAPSGDDTSRWSDSKHMLDVIYTADWADASIDENGVIFVQLHAKPAGALFHYSLTVFDEDGATPLVSDVPTGAVDPTHGEGTQVFPIDGLETSIGTWGGALYYDQRGTTVHWEHGKKIAWGNSPNEIPYMDDGGGGNAHRLYVGEVRAWTQLIYFLMPPFDNGSVAGTSTKRPTFSMRNKEWVSTSEWTYTKKEPLYKLRKGTSGAWLDDYVSPLSRLQKGHIHHVHLQAKKNY